MSQETALGKITRRETCRVCNFRDLEEIVSLGDQCLINFLDKDEFGFSSVPLELVLCNKKKGGCGLLQLRHTVPEELLYKRFWYKSGVNKTMRDALKDIVSKAEEIVNLDDNDIIIDIGANDGTLLRSYTAKNIRLIGFEPAENLVEEAKIGTTEIINNFFNYENFIDRFPNGQAKIVTSIAMFYDLEEPNKFTQDVAKILDEDGIWIIQMNYLATMLENNAFDNIVHEHLEYYSLKSLENLLRKHNLAIFDVELNEINGGSIRTYVKHTNCKKYHVTKKVEEIRNYEERLDLESEKPYHQFAERIKKLRKETFDFIKNEVHGGKKVYAYGASTRGNTLLQYYNLDNKLIKAIADRNPIKWGKKIVGTNIPIISEEHARKNKPDYFLILPWYFFAEFRERESEYLMKGGKFIVPLPTLKIINSIN